MTAPFNANTSGLTPCPFCGGEAWLNDYEAKYSDLPPMSRAPQCRSCGASLGYLTTPAKATEAWNRRVTAASAQDEREQYGRWLVAMANARDAAEARADRLANALEPFARVARWARLCGVSDLEKATAKYAKRNLFWDQFSAADAALSGDTDHAG